MIAYGDFNVKREVKSSPVAGMRAAQTRMNRKTSLCEVTHLVSVARSA
jgi:hypothetical protein